MNHYELLHAATEGGVARLTLNRPPLNVLNIAMLREMDAALDELAGDASLKALVVRAEGRMFSAGVDVADHTADKVGEMIPLFDRVCMKLADFPAPTLAVAHGHALGGGFEVVLSCDMVLASDKALLGQPEIKLATIAPIATLLLPRLVGSKLAAELLLTGETMSAPDAARLGLINRAVPAEQLAALADEWAGRLAKLSAAALRLGKRAMAISRTSPDGDGLAAIERLYLDELVSTEDAHEGLLAFMEKRAPVWRDN